MMESLRRAYAFIVELFSRMSDDKVPLLAAGLAFFSLISLAPLLVLAIAMAGLVFGESTAQEELVAQITELVGEEGGRATEAMIERAERPMAGISAAVIGIVVLLFGASRVFGALQITLDTIWKVPPPVEEPVLLAVVKARFFSFLMVLGTGFLLLVSLIASTFLAAVTKYFSGMLPGVEALWQVLNFLLFFVVTLVTFALIIRVIPKVIVPWRTVFTGAFATAVLFSIGRFLLGMYLGRGSFASVYGAAGSLVILLFWAYWSAQILCFGAELTRLLAERRGEPILPESRRRHRSVAGKEPL